MHQLICEECTNKINMKNYTNKIILMEYTKDMHVRTRYASHNGNPFACQLRN